MLVTGRLCVWLLAFVLYPHAYGFPSCHPNPCTNNRPCKTSSNGHSQCDCGENYIGEYCQDNNPCNDRCMNHGTCVIHDPDTEPRAKCICPLGFNGTLCEIINPNSICYDRPCLNGGTCVNQNTLQDYICHCQSGFRGDTCELEDYCASNPCRNGATCNARENDFDCSCRPGFKGRLCTQDVDECSETPGLCQNGATCINKNGSYQCNCTPQYTDTHCEVEYIPCAPSPCLNGGRCETSGELDYTCKCPSGKSILIEFCEKGR
ncbi:notch homolog 2 N-terminal-like protein A [Littorina saxatilis]|uniref:notch homolog 2 N-terminal-like protein A n=1 Tax=Littorina saxatilis TaxID=31220 RepID=UPI0038B58FFF